MNCPACSAPLENAMTRNGILVDRCPRCEGIWLDKGEIYHFTAAPTYLKYQINEALTKQTISGRLSPKTGEPMQAIVLFDSLCVDYCPKTQGIWLDKGEIEKLPAVDPRKLAIRIDSDQAEPEKEEPEERARRLQALRQGTANLSNLVISSAFTIVGLYALLTLILLILSLYFKLSASTVLAAGVLIALVQFAFGPWLMDITLRVLYRFNWTPRDALPQHLDAFIERVCREKKMAYPRIGIIEDGSPQAFTYGHTPNDTRIVISRGLSSLLTPEELEAVVGHELGHAKHWDMLIMTIAGLVPLILYYIYRTLIKSKGNGKGKSSALLIAIISYLLYIISEYIVLWFSRIREYFADRFAGEVTNNPNALASALVKIGYGLAGKEPETPRDAAAKAGQGTDRTPGMEAIRPLGIFDYRTANMLAVTAYNPSMGGAIDKEKLKSAMFWDKWNPWAAFFEINSTHPLIAKRLESLTEQAVSLNQEPYIVFDRKKPESYWDEFLVDLLIKFMPWIMLLVPSFILFPLLAANPVKFLALICFAIGMGYLITVLFSYTGGLDRDITIAGLLKKIKVSGVRPVACRVKGKLIGKGIPGLIYSDDFVLKDASGIIFLDYTQPLPFWNFFFGLLSAGKLSGQEVTITGWYRRAPVPFIEIRTITGESGKKHTCYTYPAKLALGMTLMAAGACLLIFAMLK